MSAKALSNLVCEASVRASKDVLDRELNCHFNDLQLGVLAFQPLHPQTTTPASARGKLALFLHELALFLHVTPERAKKILSNYLAGDFRGTKSSLKKLVNEERYRKPLLCDIWLYLRAERLYLLQVIKEIFSHTKKSSHKHCSTFATFFDKLSKGGVLKENLMKQLDLVLNEQPPSREVQGKYFSEELEQAWFHSNMREQAELLQLLILYNVNLPESFDAGDVSTLTKWFQCHQFGKKVPPRFANLWPNLNSQLVEAIGHLESMLLLCLIDLTGIASGVASEKTVINSAEVSNLDKLFSGLGSLPDHAPIMLSWMLAHYLMSDQVLRFKSIGERAIELKVLQYMNRILQNEVIRSNSVVSGVIHVTIYTVLSVLITAFDPARMNLEADVHILSCKLLSDQVIADALWKQGCRNGLGSMFEATLLRFPAQFQEPMELCVNLAEAGADSANNVLARLEDLNILSEFIENVPSNELSPCGSTGQYVTSLMRMRNGIQIPKGTTVTAEDQFYKFEVTYSGLKYMWVEMDQLIQKAAMGTSNVNREQMNRILLIVKLLEVLLRNCTTETLQTLGYMASKLCLKAVETFVHFPVPPIHVLASCIKSLSLVAHQRPQMVWERLAETGIFPFVTTSSVGENGQDVLDVNAGFVGALSAQQECVEGTYPLTTDFLDLLASCINSGLAHDVKPSLIYVIQDIFPSYQQWRFQVFKHREIFGQKLLSLIRTVLMLPSENPLQEIACQYLMNSGPNETLLSIAGTGDRVIQSLYESQSNVESGVGVELSRCVHLALEILNILILKTGLSDDQSSLKKMLCSPSQAQKPHFLLTVSHYLYHLQSCDLPLAAVKLLTTVANILPMSLLACLGSDAEAIRDIFMHRLEAHTEDILLKIEIVHFFRACVENQPGLIQMLIGVKDVSMATVTTPKTIEQSSLTGSTPNDSMDLVGEQGCLTSVMELLNRLEEFHKAGKEESDYIILHVAVTEFVYSLWSYQRILAVSYLKKRPEFWTILTWPLFDSNAMKRCKLVGCILRIIASEIYTYKGNLEKSLVNVLSNFFDDKKDHLCNWCSLVENKLSLPQMEVDDGTKAEDEAAFLLSSWKAFLLVTSHDRPSSLTPAQCHLVVSSLMQAILKLLPMGSPDIRTTTALAETCLALMQRWSNKLADTDKISELCAHQGQMLQQLEVLFERLHPRCNAALLGIAFTSLKFSSFNLEQDQILEEWLRPMLSVLKYSLFRAVTVQANLQVCSLSLVLLTRLLSRLSSSVHWYDMLHRKSVVQALLSALHHQLLTDKVTEVIQDILGLLILVAEHQVGCYSILANDLSQLLWLPLSSIKTYTKDWTSVFFLSIQLARSLQLTGQHAALQNSFAAVSLMREQLSHFLNFHAMGFALKISGLRMAQIIASLIALLMKHFQQWQLDDPQSLMHFHQAMCSLLHTSVCLLIRPMVLSSIVQDHECYRLTGRAKQHIDLSFERMRKVSSAEDYPNDVTYPEVARAQSLLLHTVSSCLKMLLTLSPDLVALITDDIVDYASYDQLLQVGFSTPTFEQDDMSGLSYGTVISICNHCIRSLTKGDRSPSPLRSGSTSSAVAERVLDNKMLLLVLEEGVTLLVSQALLCLSSQKLSIREKQLMKRELGAELGSLTETMRRYINRCTKSPQATVKLTKSDEDFLKFVSVIAQKAFI